MHQRALPVGRGHPSQRQVPASMQGFEQRQRRLDRRGPRLRQLHPQRLVVGTDGRLVLGQRQLAAEIGVQVAVRHMVDELADGPTARPVGSVELERGEPRDRLAQPLGSLGNGRDHAAPLLGAEAGGTPEGSDRIAHVGGLGHRLSIPGGQPPAGSGYPPCYFGCARLQVSSCSLIQLSLTLASRVWTSWLSPCRTKVSRSRNCVPKRRAEPSKTSLSPCQPAVVWLSRPLALSTVAEVKIFC